MARPGLSEDQIHGVIQALEREGKDVTVTRVRSELGNTGSYSTIGQVLSRHREEKQRAERPAIPDVPEPVHGHLKQLWLEAWQSASGFHAAERQAFTHERALFEKAKAEMAGEILRLEGEVSQAQERCADLQKHSDEQRTSCNELRLSLATAEGRLAMLEVEHKQGRADNQKLLEDIAVWVERATKAESKLGEGRPARRKVAGKRGE